MIFALALSPDGKLLAVVPALRVWDLETNREVTGFTKPDKAEGYLEVAFSPDGKALAVCGQVRVGERLAGVVRVWDVGTRQLRWSASRTTPVVCLAWSPDGAHLAAGSDGGVTIWNSDGTKERFPWEPQRQGEGGTISTLAWSHDGKRIVHTCSSAAYVWDVETGREVVIAIRETFHNRRESWRGRPVGIVLESGHFRAFAFAPDDRSVFATGRMVGDLTNGPITSDVWVWDLDSNRESRKLANHPSGVLGLSIEPGGRSLVTTGFSDPFSSEQTVDAHGWDLTTGGKLWTLSAHTEGGSLGYGRFAITPDHKRLAIRGRANGGQWFVNVYDLPPPP